MTNGRITPLDMEILARKRRVSSLHRWFNAVKRSVSQPAYREMTVRMDVPAGAFQSVLPA